MQVDYTRRHIKNSTMNAKKAQRLYAGIDPNYPYLTRADFMDDLAALSSVFKDDMTRVARSTNRPLWRVLWCPRLAAHGVCLRK